MSGELAFAAGSVVATSLVDRVTAELSAAILDGRLSQGEMLPGEARLAASFGVSKQVVREALRHLAALGAVQTDQGRASRVRTLDAEPLGRFWRFAAGHTAEGLAEAVELRRILEPQVARLAAMRRTVEELAELEAILARMRAALADPDRWIQADLDFHDQIGRMAHNRLVRLQVHGLRPVIAEIMQRFSRRSDADLRVTWQRHARVAQAIAAGDPDAADAAMVAHFAAADQAMADLFPGKAPGPD